MKWNGMQQPARYCQQSLNTRTIVDEVIWIIGWKHARISVINESTSITEWNDVNCLQLSEVLAAMKRCFSPTFTLHKVGTCKALRRILQRTKKPDNHSYHLDVALAVVPAAPHTSCHTGHSPSHEEATSLASKLSRLSPGPMEK